MILIFKLVNIKKTRHKKWKINIDYNKIKTSQDGLCYISKNLVWDSGQMDKI